MSWKTTLAQFLLRFVAPTAIEAVQRQLSPAPFDVDTPLAPADHAHVRVRRPLPQILSDERDYLDQVLSRQTTGMSPAQLVRLDSQIANIRARIKMYETRLEAENKGVATAD